MMVYDDPYFKAPETVVADCCFMTFIGSEGASGKGGRGGYAAEEKTYEFQFGGSNFPILRRRRAVFNTWSFNHG